MAEHKCSTLFAGQRFGRWTLISKSSRTHWLCRCSCNTVRAVNIYSLLKGGTLSCGCYRDEQASQHGKTHGLSHTAEHHAWSSLKGRCYNPRNARYSLYGGRGIRVCDRWLQSFENFYADMGLKPSPKHSIDRIDVNGDYEPSNCRWVIQKEQMRNMRRTQWVEYGGICLSLAEWSEQLGLNAKRVDTRLARGWSIEDAFTIPCLKTNALRYGSKITNRKRLYA